MAKLQEIDAKACRKIHADLIGWLESFGEESGIVTEVGSGRYRPDEITFKLKCKLINERDDGKSLAQIEFEQIAPLHGLEAEDFGKKFIDRRGTSYTICGIKPSRWKYPIVATSVLGTRYKFSLAQVKRTIQR